MSEKTVHEKAEAGAIAEVYDVYAEQLGLSEAGVEMVVETAVRSYNQAMADELDRLAKDGRHGTVCRCTMCHRRDWHRALANESIVADGI